MMEWLTNNHVYLEVDSLGHETIRTIGYFLNVHPRIMHKTLFKANICNMLEQVKITKEEVLKLDAQAQFYYNQTKKSSTMKMMMPMMMLIPMFHHLSFSSPQWDMEPALCVLPHKPLESKLT